MATATTVSNLAIVFLHVRHAREPTLRQVVWMDVAIATVLCGGLAVSGRRIAVNRVSRQLRGSPAQCAPGARRRAWEKSPKRRGSIVGEFALPSSQTLARVLIGAILRPHPMATPTPPARRAMTPDLLWTLPRVGSPAPTPAGRRAVVGVTTYDLENNEGLERLWLIRADGANPPRALTDDQRSAHGAAVSPDGRRVAFVQARGGRSRPVWVLPLDGGEAAMVTDFPLGPRRARIQKHKARATEPRVYRLWDRWSYAHQTARL